MTIYKKRGFKKGAAVFTAMLTLLLSMITFNVGSVTAEAAGATGVGLAQHALNCYYGGWQYEYGYAGQTVNGVTYSDCSGMIYAYVGSSTPRSSSGQISGASASGSVSSIPRIHGLGLWQSGHVGVYVGGGMAVDCRSDQYNVVYQSVSRYNWVKWYKVPGVSYPTNGWVTFAGNKYYYEDGQYVAGATRTIDGVTYTFAADGRITSSSNGVVPEDTASVETPSYSGASSGGTSSSDSVSSSSSSAARTAAAVYTDLGLASQGTAVKNLQQRLSDLGYYYDMVNDYYDAFIRDAVSCYQEVAGLEVTGTADVETQKSLFASDAKANPNKGRVYPGLHSGLVKQMQERLVELGYMDCETSFYYGDATREAVLAYQEQAGLEADGILEAGELEVLHSEEAVKAPEPEEPEESTEEAPVAETVSAKGMALSSGVTAMEAIIPTVAAAEEQSQDAEIDPLGNIVFVAFLVVLCLSLTVGFFVLQRAGGFRNVAEMAKERVVEFSHTLSSRGKKA